jgi:seryl-tRNA synthetase
MGDIKEEIMLDIRLIREKPDLIKAGLTRIGSDCSLVDKALEYDDQRRKLETEISDLRNQRNTGSKEIGKLKDSEDREKRKSEMRELGDRISAAELTLSHINEAQQSLMLTIPNLALDEVPDGPDERSNIVIKTSGSPREFPFHPRPHWEVGQALGILDIDRGVKISGSRFYVLKGAGAALQRALISWFLDVHIMQQGYTEIYPPFIVKRDCLVGTGQLPKFEDNLYHDIEEDFWMVPTAEVPVTNLHRDEILDASLLPLNYVAYTPCFRREKMSAGRDVRGIKRGHQFDKVEMVKICLPEESRNELDVLVHNAEALCDDLGIPWRLVKICTGDKGFSNMIQFDMELYAPACGDGSEGEWLEVSSCSNFGDFQARRANIRFRREPGAKPEYVHTLNGSGLALPRVMIAILENYQNEDGSVAIPPVLRPYMHGMEVIR